MNKFKLFWGTNKEFRLLIWSIITALATYWLTELTNLPAEYQATVVPFATLIIREWLKYINVKWFWDLWVK